MADDLNYLQQKAREWAAKVVNLHHMQVPPEFASQKAALLDTAKSIKNAVEKITGPLTYLEPMNQLGFLPVVVGVVGVAGATALIVKWSLDYSTFVKKVQDRNRLIAGGMNPQQAANIVNMAEKQGTSLFGFDFKKLAFPAIVLGAGFFYGKKQGWF